MNDHEDTNGSKESFREQDIYLPIANVARIMKNAIPQTGKVIPLSDKESVLISLFLPLSELELVEQCIFPNDPGLLEKSLIKEEEKKNLSRR